VPVEANPFGVAVHPSGTHVYVGNTDSNTVSVIDVATQTVVGGPVPVGTAPAGLAVHPDGSRLYVANELDGTVSIIDVSATPPQIVGNPVPVGVSPRGVAVNPAGTRVYVANNNSGTVSVIDTTSTPPAVSTVAVGVRPVGVAVHPTGARVYVTNVMSNTVSVLDVTVDPPAVATLALQDPARPQEMPRPLGVAVHPGGSHVYVANAVGSIAVIATSTSAVTYVQPDGQPAPGLFGIAVAPAGGQVYAVNQQTGSLYVLDTASQTATRVQLDFLEPNSFGAFISPASNTCDTSALEQALAEAQGRVTTLQAANQALLAEKKRAEDELGTVRATIESFADRLFGDDVDGKIAAAARAVALGELTAARAAARHSWRVRLAQHSFDQGEKALRKREWRRAVREYREVHHFVEPIVRGLPGGTDGTTTVISGPGPVPGMPATNGDCDTSALEQALAAALRQVASLQAANQSLTAENLRLGSELAAAKAVVTSFVMRLFGERTDGNVAGVARDAARDTLARAKAVAPHDRRLRLADQSFEQGQHAMRKHDWGRAVHEFRETHEVSERILKDKHAHRR
jgi:YVTN family beta-propeller protein